MDKDTVATSGTAEPLTYEMLLEAEKMLREQKQKPYLTPKQMFFIQYFPDIKDIDAHVIVISHLVEGVDQYRDTFDWLFIDNYMTDTTMYAVKKTMMDGRGILKPFKGVSFDYLINQVGGEV